jgi:hypothetical protein
VECWASTTLEIHTNGGGERIATLDIAAGPIAWARLLREKLPAASERISLWNADGEELWACAGTPAANAHSECAHWAHIGECQSNPAFMRAECATACSSLLLSTDEQNSISRVALVEAAALAGEKQLYAVTDVYPFVWPASAVGSVRHVSLGDGQPHVALRTLSSTPRILLAEGIVSEEECAAIRRLGAPLLKPSTTRVGGKEVVASLPSDARTSWTAWLSRDRPERRKKLDAVRSLKNGLAETAVQSDVAGTAAASEAEEDADMAVLERVEQRIASLVRLHRDTAENMQVLRYLPGEHYHYHSDTGGAPNIRGRAITALFYLNDAYEGGRTNFPLVGHPEGAVNVYRVREEFKNCQTARGLTIEPQKGAVLIWYNHQTMAYSNQTAASAEIRRTDPRVWHASCDVTSGQKWSANYWFHLDLARQLSMRGVAPQRSQPVALTAAPMTTAASAGGRGLVQPKMVGKDEV